MSSEKEKTKNKLVFITFQGINNGVPWGMARVIVPILEFLNKNDIYFEYYTSLVSGYYNNDIKIQQINSIYIFLTKIINKINKFILLIPNYKIRYFQETLFDYLVSWKIKEGCTIISTAHLKKTTKKNSKLGGKNILYMSNPNEVKLFELLNKEKNKYKINFTDAYTYKKRIKFTLESTESYDHIICISSSVYETFSQKFRSEKLSIAEYHIIPNKAKFKDINVPKSKMLTFIYIGHTVWLKGIYYLLKAWEVAKVGDSQLIIGGIMNPEIESFIKFKFNNLKNVEYIGYIENPNKLYRFSHVFISPSLLDAHPSTVTEAMYCKLPVIVSDGCGAKSLVEDGINGFVVESGNFSAIAEKIEWFFNNKNKIQEMGNNARREIDNLLKSNQNEKVAYHILKIVKKLNGKN